jgi:hypothetical protein
MAALMWFGIDDSSTSVHFPVYGSSTRVSKGWAGKGPQDGEFFFIYITYYPNFSSSLI